MLQRFNKVENAEVPADSPIRFHHTIENRSGSGVQVRLYKADCWEKNDWQHDMKA